MRADHPYEVLREIIGRQWTVPVLLALTRRPLRYTEVLQQVHALDGREALSGRALSDAVKYLQRQELVSHSDEPHAPYQLTPRAQELLSLLWPLESWVARHRIRCVG